MGGGGGGGGVGGWGGGGGGGGGGVGVGGGGVGGGWGVGGGGGGPSHLCIGVVIPNSRGHLTELTVYIIPLGYICMVTRYPIDNGPDGFR